ncbi:MAG: porin, partial [Rhodobacteraceae bacterium]|nr:porin [Paracoccaceae bacterium]
HLDAANVYVKTDVWSVSAGNLDPATQIARKLPDIGFGDGIGVDNVAEAATPTAADIELGVTLGPATVKMTYGNRKIPEVPRMELTPGMAAVPELKATTGQDVDVPNPLYDPDAEDGLAAIEYIGWMEGDDAKFLNSVKDDVEDVEATATTHGLQINVEPGAGATPNDATDDVPVTVSWDSVNKRFKYESPTDEAEDNTDKADEEKAAKEAHEARLLALIKARAGTTSKRTIYGGGEAGLASATLATRNVDCDGDGDSLDEAKTELAAAQEAYGDLADDEDDATKATARSRISAAETAIKAEDADDDGLVDCVKLNPIEVVVQEGKEAVEATYSEGTPAGDDDEWAIGIGFSNGDNIDFGIGYDSNKMVNMGVASKISGISAALYYEKPKDTMGANMGVNIGMEVTEGMSVNVGFSRGYDSDDMRQTGVGVGMSHDLGGGATFQFGAGRVKGDTAADAGISMSF